MISLIATGIGVVVGILTAIFIFLFLTSNLKKEESEE